MQSIQKSSHSRSIHIIVEEAARSGIDEVIIVVGNGNRRQPFIDYFLPPDARRRRQAGIRKSGCSLRGLRHKQIGRTFKHHLYNIVQEGDAP